MLPMNADVEDSRIIIEHFLQILLINQLNQRFYMWEDICVKANKWGQKDRWTYESLMENKELMNKSFF